MLDGRFEPAGGGLRLVWAFWGCGGVAGAGGSLVVAVAKLSRRSGARAARRKRGAAKLQMAVAGETSWRTPRRTWESSEIEGCNTLRPYNVRGELPISCASRRGRVTRASASRFLLVCIPARKNYRRADIPVCRGRARPGADGLVLSRDRKGLVKPPRGASTPNPHDARLSPVTPLQEPSRDLWRPCVRCRRSYQRKQESGSRRARANSNPQNGPQTPLSNL